MENEPQRAQSLLPIQHRLNQIRDLAAANLFHLDFEAILEIHYRRWVQPGDVVIDVGAHAGRHLIPLLESVGPTGTAFAFEPIPEMARQLADRLKDNRATVVNAALSNWVGTTEFVLARGTPEESGLRERIYNSPDRADPIRIEVRVDSIDNYARDLQSLSFIKIDVEGGEIDCLRGAMQTLNRLRPLVSVEYGFPSYSVYGNTKETLFDLATSAGYVLYDIFLNPLESLAEWSIACDYVSWDFLMVPSEKRTEFEARMEAKASSAPVKPVTLRIAELEARNAVELATVEARSHDALALLEAQNTRLAAELSAQRQVNAELLTSTSWRVTAPLRAVKSAISAKTKKAPRA